VKFILEIECDNDSFADDAAFEVGRILRELSGKISTNGPLSKYPLRDSNGNRVGCAEFKIDDDCEN